MAAGRVAWIDYSKGIGIILVVMAYSAGIFGGADASGNWMLGLAAWATPVVVPAFFLISGLFLRRSIFGSAATYFDRKVLHLAYFFAIWLAIETVFLNAGAIARSPLAFLSLYASGWIAPESPLWFIHELAVFYIVTRLTRRLPANRVFIGAAVLQVLAAAGLFQTGWTVADRFAAYYVYFFAGYAAVPVVFHYVRGIARRANDITGVLAVWLAVHTAFVAMGIAGLPVVSLILGFAGTFALIAGGALLSHLPAAQFIGYAGRNSLAVYLCFFIPVHVLHAVLTATGLIPDAGAASLATAVASIALSLLACRLALETPLRVLFVRPQILRFKAARSAQRGSLLSASIPTSSLPEL